MMKNTFRLPTFNDLYYRRMGNTGLRPEKATEWNVGITWNMRPSGRMEYLAMTIDGYYNDVEDKIVAFPGTYVWRMANFGKVKIHGIDLTLASEISITSHVSAVINIAYTWQESKDRTKKGSATYGSFLPYTPKHSGNISVLLNNRWVNVGYSVVMQGKRWSMAQNTDEYKLSPYWEHSLSLSRELSLGKNRLLLQGTVNNLTNENYEVIKYYPMPGRSWSITGTFYL